MGKNKKKMKPDVPTTLAMLKSIPNCRNKWHHMTPREKNLYFYGIGRLVMGIAGLPLFQEKLIIKWYGHLVLCNAIFNFTLMIYTLFYWAIHGDFTKALPSTCMQIGPIVGVSFTDILPLTSKNH